MSDKTRTEVLIIISQTAEVSALTEYRLKFTPSLPPTTSSD